MGTFTAMYITASGSLGRGGLQRKEKYGGAGGDNISIKLYRYQQYPYY